MPIRIPVDLPALGILDSENIFALAFFIGNGKVANK